MSAYTVHLGGGSYATLECRPSFSSEIRRKPGSDPRQVPEPDRYAVDAALVAPLGPPADAGLYLLHLEPRYRHAGHYLGWAAKIDRRVGEHLAGGSKASPLIRAQLAAGGLVELARVWVDGDRTLERRLKRQGGLSRHCPTCRKSGRYHA